MAWFVSVGNLSSMVLTLLCVRHNNVSNFNLCGVIFSRKSMAAKPLTYLSCFVLLMLLAGCTRHVGHTKPTRELSSCQIIYDAGSSGTRLYVYELTAKGWLRHAGPKVGALADPVRENRGKSMSDARTVVMDVVEMLDNMRHDGPPGKNGQPEWQAFGWPTRCEIGSVAVYATGGMRLAEQRAPQASKRIWKMLNDSLSTRLEMKVTTRTLTGFEEGFFAWLALRESRMDENFGVAEMGGASVQLTFLCPDCEESRQVRVKNRAVAAFSRSFEGWGQDEAWKKFSGSSACETGAGLRDPNWHVDKCKRAMRLSADAVASIKSQLGNRRELNWYLSGAFRYRHSTDIERYCREGMDSGFEPLTSCFRAVYQEYVLDSLGLPENAEPTGVDWTLGAVVCAVTRCLEQLP